MKACRKCDITKPESDFYVGHRQCKKCHNTVPNTPERQRKRRLIHVKRTYNLTEEQLIALGSECRICGATDDLCVDHDHRCCPGEKSCGKCVRFILCRRHNTMIARANDNPAILRRAADLLDGLDLSGGVT